VPNHNVKFPIATSSRSTNQIQQTQPALHPNTKSVQKLIPEFGRNYESGFFPGKRPENFEAQNSGGDFEEEEENESYPQFGRSDDEANISPQPVDTNDFRPHQKVYRTKNLDTATERNTLPLK